MCSTESIIFYDLELILSSQGKKGVLTNIKVDNVKSLVDINPIGPQEDAVFVYSGMEHDLIGKVNIRKINEISSKKNELQIAAHNGQIDFVRLSPQGKYLATCSQKGTLIRVWSTKGSVSLDENGENSAEFELIKELRRGTSSRFIKDICFNYSQNILMVSSNSQYVHIFYLNEENSKSKFQIFGAISSYFASEWSKVKLKLPEGQESFGIWNNEDNESFYIFLKNGFVKDLSLMGMRESEDEQEILWKMDDFKDLFDSSLIEEMNKEYLRFRDQGGQY